MCRIFGIYFYRIFREICIIIPKLAQVFVCCKVFCMGGTVALQHLNMKFTELQICILVLLTGNVLIFCLKFWLLILVKIRTLCQNFSSNILTRTPFYNFNEWTNLHFSSYNFPILTTAGVISNLVDLSSRAR